MIRWATITQKTDQAIQLKVHKASSCDGCQLHCDKPLFDVFKLKKDHFWVSKSESKVSWVNLDLLFSDQRPVGHKVGLDFTEVGLLQAALRLYILPLLLSLVTMLIGQQLFISVGWTADFGALLGFVFGFVLFYLLMQSHKVSKDLPKVTFL